MTEGSSQGRLSFGIKTVAALLFIIIVASISLATPIISLDDLEKHVTADRKECYMGEFIKVSFIIQNPLDHDVRFEPIRQITFMTSQGGEPWVSAEVHMDYRTGAMISIPSGGNCTLHSQVFTPTLPGFFKVNALGEFLRVWVHPYKEENLDSQVYLNISAVNKVRVGEKFKATFDIINDNDYVIQLKYSSIGMSHGYENESHTGIIKYISWFANVRVQPHSRYTYRTTYFSPSRPGEYLLVFTVDEHDTLRRVKVEPREGTVIDARYIS